MTGMTGASLTAEMEKLRIEEREELLFNLNSMVPDPFLSRSGETEATQFGFNPETLAPTRALEVKPKEEQEAPAAPPGRCKGIVCAEASSEKARLPFTFKLRLAVVDPAEFEMVTV